MAIDTLAVSRSLREAGFPEPQADVIAEQIGKAHAVDLSNLATKADLGTAVSDIRREMSELKVWLISAMVAVAGIALAIAKLT